MQIESIPLAGLNLVEASAGTGKTYALTSIYLRLLLEQDLGPESILVMTYTNAATAELKTRIRQRLVTAREVFDNGETDDPLLRDQFDRQADRETLRRRLDLALANFDQAAIHTIHGFCQRVLSDYAFESRQGFRTELVTDLQQRQQQVMDDFWRREMNGLPPDLLKALLREIPGPDYLLRLLKPALGKPYLKVQAEAWPESSGETLQRFREKQAQLLELWNQARDLLGELLSDNRVLNGRMYQKRYLSGWFDGMDRLLVSDPGEAPFAKAERFTQREIRAAVKPGMQPPEHPLFNEMEGFLELAQACRQVINKAVSNLLRQGYEYLSTELPRRQKQANEWSYDDLLLQLSGALRMDTGGALSGLLRKRYPVALIDEFQDTDPVQYEIVQGIYGKQPKAVFLVGDPKQAIYSFRGADIYTYLRAREHPATRHHSLDINWRSSAKMIRAVNTLFEFSQDPFFDERIPFEPVRAAPDRAEGNPEVTGLGGAALHVWYLEGASRDRVDDVRQSVADATAGEIANLLSGATPPVTIGGRGIRGSDIAVLVRSHKQGQLMARALRSHGVHSVSNSPVSVYRTPEAEALERVLLAILEPHRVRLVRTALASALFGWEGAAIDALNTDDAAQGRIIQRFFEFHQIWSKQGFVAMIRSLMQAFGVETRLLGFSDGERRLTNLYHLVELCHQQDSLQQPGMEGLVTWFRRQLLNADIEEEHLLRLESDGHWVRIETLHHSKGLEYGIVFCPFAWDEDAGRIPSGPFLFHDPLDRDAAVLDLGTTMTARNQAYRQAEDLAESLRLLYVGLTRARYRCYLPWGLGKKNRRSALCRLLHRGRDGSASDAGGDVWLERAEALQPQDDVDRLEQLCEASTGAITWHALPTDAGRIQQSLDFPPHLSDAREAKFTHWPCYQVVSFSSLITGLSEDLPDHDQQTGGSDSHSVMEAGWDAHGFPRGSGPGSCLHAILEAIDFSVEEESGILPHVAHNLALFGIDSQWSPVVVSWLQQILSTPLNEQGLRLRDVDNRHRLNEMGFHFPVSAFQPQQIRVLAEQHRFSETPALLDGLMSSRASAVDGYVKGFIDLVFEHAGRFYLADYKSNWLGMDAADYQSQALQQAMVEHHYTLQYVLYTLALHRYLKHRLPGYDYQRHIGGVFYLFLRGMRPDNDQPLGILFECPPAEFIAALDRMVGGDRE
ncbi:MAG: exodeoxyribonuclease V subunit beta [Candidatus Thiodiazotropha sp.]